MDESTAEQWAAHRHRDDRAPGPRGRPGAGHARVARRDRRRVRRRPADPLPADGDPGRAGRSRRRGGRGLALPRHRQGGVGPQPPAGSPPRSCGPTSVPRSPTVILAHQDFQGRHYYEHFDLDPNLRDQYRGEPWYALAEQFADEWDQTSFDPDYPTEAALPLRTDGAPDLRRRRSHFDGPEAAARPPAPLSTPTRERARRVIEASRDRLRPRATRTSRSPPSWA